MILSKISQTLIGVMGRCRCFLSKAAATHKHINETYTVVYMHSTIAVVYVTKSQQMLQCASV